MGPGPFWMLLLTPVNELTAPGLEDYAQQRLAVPASRHKQTAYYIGANVIEMALKKAVGFSLPLLIRNCS